MNWLSKYTTEIRYYCETLAGMKESSSNVQEVLTNSWNKVFDFDFPIFNEEHREVLCKKILLHYYFREIGLETVGIWKIKLQSKLIEIMPYYNRLYKALDEDFNILYSQDKFIDRNSQGEMQNTSSSSSESENEMQVSTTNENTNRFLDTPQGGLDGIIDSDYLTNATIDEGTSTQSSNDTSTATNNSTTNGTNEHTEHVHEYGGNDKYANLERYNAEVFNIDVRIINELEDLFMKVW